jgi:hypothetical protein
MNRGQQYRHDEYERLTWVEREMRGHADAWTREAARLAGLCDGGERAVPLNAKAHALAACAREVEEVIAASHVEGGPPVDHLAMARWHLEQLAAQRGRRPAAAAGEAAQVPERFAPPRAWGPS